MALTSGSRLGPYEILSPLGSGGMGEVWKARDTRLDRLVAIKQVAPRSFERFETEARAIAALNHPNICQIHDIGPDYLVLEYVDGTPLQGPLAVDEVLRVAIQITGALDIAHRRGILHRDLKPANILIERRSAPSDLPTVKILDFGLAKRMEAGADVTLTQDGTVLGTVAYMSPEQAEGRPVDARSDIFSFGAVLYEMLSGSRAFPGTTTVQVLQAVVRSEPAPLQALPALAGIVRQCLAKDPDRRFATMADVTEALEQASRTPGSTSSADAPPSIAVLPFANMSRDPDDEYFSDGLAEEIINLLANVPGLRVTARTSAFAFRGKEQDITTIAEALRVRTILEGSVRRAGSRIRVTAQLINAEDGYHLWSERYDRELTDVFAIQDDIAQAIASALQMKLVMKPARHTPPLPAYEAYLRARHQMQQWTPATLARSKESLEQAIAIDPGFAQAYAELGGVYYAMVTENQLLPRVAAGLMRGAAQRALEIDSELSSAHVVMALVAMLDYDWVEAGRQFRTAFAHKPISLLSRYFYGWYLCVLDRMEEVDEEMDLALQEDPLNLLFQGGRGMYWLGTGRTAEGEARLRHVLELDERFWIADMWLGGQRVSEGLMADALAFTEKGHALAPGNFFAIGQLAGILTRIGDAERANALMAQLGDGSAFGAPGGFVAYYLVLSDIDKAADWFEKVIEQRDTRAPWIQPHMFGAALRSSPRWPKLARMMNLPTS